MVTDAIRKHPAVACRPGEAIDRIESLAVEEPLEIRLAGRRFTLTMRTPGHDAELVAGFLLAEGFVNSFDEISEIRQVRDRKGAFEPNILDVILNVPAASLRERLRRNFVVSSSCGVCGKSSIEALERRIAPLEDDLRLEPQVLLRMPSTMRDAQQVFAATGGLHAAAIFRGSALVVLREDIGRHNAVDKTVGYALAGGLVPLHDSAMMVSGRLSFEIVQKAASAGIPILCAVSAPSSLAVELAEEAGVTLVGFLRERGFNVYSHRERILLSIT
jgi:FdhD protein